MFHPHLRHPTPEIARIGEGRYRERCKGGGRVWREEDIVLPHHDRGIRPIHPQSASAQPQESRIDAVGRRRETTRQIDLQIGPGLRPGYRGPKRLNSDLGLPQRSPETATRIAGLSGIGQSWDIKVVNDAVIAYEVHQNNTGKAQTVFRGALYFCLILIVDLSAQQLIFLFQ